MINPETATAEITIHFAPGPALRYGDLSVQGDTTVHVRFFERQKLWESDDWYDITTIERFEKNIIQSGLFSRVSVRPLPEEEKDTVNLQLIVTERHPRTLRLGANFRSDVGFGLNAAWEHRNILGKGERLNTRAVLAEDEQELALGFRVPVFSSETSPCFWEQKLSRSIPMPMKVTVWRRMPG